MTMKILNAPTVATVVVAWVSFVVHAGAFSATRAPLGYMKRNDHIRFKVT